ncbi:phage tail protein [Bacillus sp. FJAT-49732]|uniref:Phage tail protein n=1 Tax=Lederbergia citrisecunda TaxID=2833583 RepID=A0A942YJH9_9BACI|nr:major tail protein [Lederbergia citrisecunda]MBS4198617.1 phage tail protein [Lederbergia citrisecunda]
MSKVLHGLDMFHIAELTEDTTTSVDYETPEPLLGAVNVNVQPNTESNTFYADNGAYAVLNSLGDIDVDVEVADLPFAMQKTIYGHTEENEVQFASKDDISIDLALGFRAKTSTGGYRFYWLLKGKAELIPIEHQTDEGNTTPQTAKIKLKFMPLQHNGRWKAQAESSEQLDAAKWFKDVVYKGDILTSTP